MSILKAGSTSEVHSGGKGRQDDLGDGVAATNGILQNTEIAIVLDGRGDLGATPLDLITRYLQHLVSILVTERTSARANRLIAKVGRDESELVLSLNGSLEEALHELESLLLVIEHAAAIDGLEVQVEVTVLETGIENLLNLSGVLGEEETVVHGLHGPDGDLFALPFHGLRHVGDGSHDAG